MKSGRSISLDLETWLVIEKYRKKNGVKDISSAIEQIIRKNLKVNV